jgi:hypothetical protein
MQILTNDELRRLAPATFADAPVDTVSDRYQFIPTINLVQELQSNGWQPTRAWQARQGANVDRAHTTHEITFQRPHGKVQVGGVLPQIRLINDHMARRAWRLFAGFFKLICSNGLVVSAGIGETQARVIHLTGADLTIGEALLEAIGTLDDACEVIARWQKIVLKPEQEMQFANAAAMIRKGTPELPAGVKTSEFLTRHRAEDTGHDLWTVFNVVQENVIKGGVAPFGRPLRGIRSAPQDIKINTQLWDLAGVFAELVRNGQSLS